MILFLGMMLVPSLTLQAGECKQVKLNKHEAVDRDCKLFRINKGFVELRKHGDWEPIEKIDCSKAVLDPDGAWYYYSKVVNARFECKLYKEDLWLHK